ncbi:ABC transporter ATP-binding protein [Roseovarius rhodophyticola]|uniref:ATP-binding cassette domain-containing protein n=1 Tax=Roseovarius rhodophyticola TaxID=3080827 RepID=A0ABZ2TP05_9RHOB|nr:ATP-binding cassette domain-containing protein [Roseovarius sp. W115]MDV2927876.1 ATP-binding cassette domain-containing protein [Roseovarius sp. W115]
MDSGQDTVLECRGVVKRYGALAAVDGVDFNVKVGECVGIGGPNGAGKTTFFDLISGLTPVTDGTITYKGSDIVGTAPHLLCHRGLARTFQLNSGFDDLSVYENVLAAQAFGRRSAGGIVLAHKADHEAARRILADIGLECIASEKVAGVSVLARKKLMVATALVNEPDIILLDEPVGGLTPPEIEEFIALVQRFKARGLTLVFIEHVMHFLMAVADRAMIMHQGQIIYDGSPQGLSTDKTVTEVYLGSAGIGGAD